MKKTAILTKPERKALRATVLSLALLGGAGLFFSYANPVYQLPPLALLLPACLVTFAHIVPTARGAFYAGWLCASLGSSACLYWISVPMHDYGMVPWPFTVPAVLALGSYLGLYGGLFSLIYRLFREYLPFFAALLLVCPLWAALDIAREYLFTGFPWISLAAAFIPWEDWVQGASFVGSSVLSGLFALIAATLAEARPVRLSPAFSSMSLTRKRRAACYGITAVCTALVYLSSFAPPLPEGRAVTVGLIQGNVDQNQKWDPAYQVGTLNRYLTLSEWTVNPALGRVQKPVDLLVWPETALPFYYEAHETLAGEVAEFVAKFSVPVVFGAPGKSDRPDGRGYYNRMWLQSASPFARQKYDKAHLVPFGEYVPLNIPLPFIEYLMQGLDFIQGTDRAPLMTGDLALGGLICYEAIFPELARQRVESGANLLVNISNDSWFRRTAAPAQHLHLTAMRAVEQGRYVARATNTGISAVITPRGRIAAHGSLFKSEALIGTVRLVSGRTVYHRIEPYLFWGSLAISGLALGWCLAQARKREKK